MSKAQRTKQFIIEKTAPIFNMKGYSGTSMSDITEATGLTKGSIYGNFANKDEVALAAFRFNVKKLHDIFAREIEKEKTFKGKLLVYPRLYSDYYDLRVTQGGCPIINTATEADDTHPVLKKKVERVILSWKEQLVYFIEQGILLGEFKAHSIDPEKTALTIIAMIEGTVMIAKITGNLSTLADIMLSVTKIIEDLV
ncbi:TetR/AcrR family transcriptional regulator [Flavobacterium johnsoniae]|uniref:Predicted transcriptional regulator, TetR family n=2 Tax=Flavobacterium johnsoniae TaxID=986 RepID=A5FEH4_FLAJ1|nr:TetR/AcrR family transcriptional regulator [Flavobacterium johnsoniae]ABQ06389.1 predicted transcriptional regulator, TetR family [Flavobacterium johnsoniae UW101]OXE95107.1 TetR family transcriptional regulator [Flavobacterium johnsoniae UW101]WQG82139.1 TetR/AcrR family transcriptional regulator [Flavobacterium johnsoniae UW101]SHK73873.1 transcriptional regulator, TetR family [Flavobacterium johnsoniae]